MKVDAYIASAIDQYIMANKLTQAGFAKQLGISEATMVKWRRQGNGITGRRWAELYKHIKRYLPKERIFTASNGEEHYSSANEGAGVRVYFEPKYIPQMVPVLEDKDLQAWPQMVQSVEQYVAGRDYKRAEYRARGPEAGVFCYMLSSATIGIPQGAQLFVSGEAKPTNGGLVLAVTTSGEIILATYTATGNTFTLTGSQNITGQLSKAQELFTMLAPVIEYTVFIR